MASVPALIRQYSRRYGVDPRAALAVARTEGGLRTGAVGDQGTSYGPFQLHVGGALPRGKGAAWANSAAGIEYAIRQMAAAGARGLTGRAAIEAIVRKFERPADPDSQVAKALGFYGSAGLGGSESPTGGPQGVTAANIGDIGASGGGSSAWARALLDPRVSRDPMALLGAIKDVQAPAAAPAPEDAPVQPGRRVSGITYNGQALTHQTDGLAGYPAVDLFAKPGTPFLAPEDGRIVRLSGRGGNSGNVYGLSVYFQGRSGKLYYITHLGTTGRPGHYRAGQPLGTVSDWKSGKPHAHVGIGGGP